MARKDDKKIVPHQSMHPVVSEKLNIAHAKKRKQSPNNLISTKASPFLWQALQRVLCKLCECDDVVVQGSFPC